MGLLSNQLMNAPFAEPVLARGRGLAKLIEGLSEGDPVAWGITVVIVLVMIGIGVYKRNHD
jgi:hypothetical protein